MVKLTKEDMVTFIGANIQTFHTKRLENLLNLKLNDILKRKNPYLFKAKNLVTAPDLVKSLLDAHLSSQEEGIFGGFLEELAIFICNKTYSGKKSSAEGIDLEFEKRDIKYIVTIKSGPNWGNSQQVSRMRDNFKKAKRILGTNTSRAKIVAVNGCCYGIDDNPNKGDYLKLCGHTEIIEPLGHKAKERNEGFLEEYAKVINKFTLEFAEEYCNSDGKILWDKIVKFNSAKRKNIGMIF